MFQNIPKVLFRVSKPSNLLLKTSAGKSIIGSVLYYNHQIRDDSIRLLYNNQKTFYTTSMITYLGSKVMTFNVSYLSKLNVIIDPNIKSEIININNPPS